MVTLSYPSKIRSAPSIVHKPAEITKTMLFCVGFEDSALILYGKRFPLKFIVAAEPAIQGGDGGRYGLLS